MNEEIQELNKQLHEFQEKSENVVKSTQDLIEGKSKLEYEFSELRASQEILEKSLQLEYEKTYQQYQTELSEKISLTEQLNDIKLLLEHQEIEKEAMNDSLREVLAASVRVESDDIVKLRQELITIQLQHQSIKEINDKIRKEVEIVQDQLIEEVKTTIEKTLEESKKSFDIEEKYQEELQIKQDQQISEIVNSVTSVIDQINEKLTIVSNEHKVILQEVKETIEKYSNNENINLENLSVVHDKLKIAQKTFSEHLTAKIALIESQNFNKK